MLLKFTHHFLLGLGGLGLLSLIGIGGLIQFTRLQRQAQNSGQTDQLSARAKEFMAKDSGQGTGLWSQVNLATVSGQTADSVQPAGIQITTPCFSVRLPFKITRPTQSQTGDRCSFSAQSLAPTAQLVIASYPAAKFAEDSGVQLRRHQAQTYHATPLQSSGFTQVVLFQSADSATVFAWQNQIMVTVALSQTSQPELATPAMFEEILTNFKFNLASASARPSQLLP